MSRAVTFLNMLTQFHYLEIVSFSDILPQLFHLPVFQTRIINYNVSLRGADKLSKIRIYNVTEIINLDVKFSVNFSKFVDILDSRNFRNNPTFRVFLSSNENLTLNGTTARHGYTSILLKVGNFDSSPVLETVHILREFKSIEACRREICHNIDATFKNIFWIQDTELNSQTIHVSIPSYNGVDADFFSVGDMNSEFNKLCADQTDTYSDIAHTFMALPPEICLLIGFKRKTNDTIRLVEKIPARSPGFFKITKLENILVPISVNIFPYAESRDALEYTVFVNKSSLVLNLMVLKPFDKFVWTAFFTGAMAMSLILCYSLQKGWSYLGASLFWAIGVFWGQGNQRFESEVRHVCGLLIATWSLTMITLSNCYADLFYAELMTGVKPNVANNLGGILSQGDIKVYTFKNHHDSGQTDAMVGKMSAFKSRSTSRSTKVNDIRVPDVASFEISVHSLAYFGRVGGKKISPKFILLQSSSDLDKFAALMKITDRFVRVKNDDFHLIGIRAGWTSSRNSISKIFGSMLKGYSESGIYSVWGRRWHSLLKRAGLYLLRKKIKKINSKGDHGGSVGKQRALSWGQVRMNFVLLAAGAGVSGLAQFMEVAWFVNMEKYIELK
ncbi:hypothetical protein Fcan01_18295 [Folsomia candida]|uniref:Uncharacterized protein n=1 Tax=Folsomia candida TaxID=158441 RepID=A0A226DSG4_FOLCA|nr:hypothetical protein Fcan01_18295 [Folsomia candida]